MLNLEIYETLDQSIFLWNGVVLFIRHLYN